jgi:hypothetical protein
MRSLANDLAYGLAQEKSILNLIKKTWHNESNIQNTKDKYNDHFFKCDFESDYGTCWELKSRRVKKSTYNSTILPVHKIQKIDNKQYFIFEFTDAVSYIEYDESLFNTFKKNNFSTVRAGALPNEVLHFEIPIINLKDIFNNQSKNKCECLFCE